MIYKRMPAIIVLFASSLLAAIFAILFQPHILAEIVGSNDTSVETLFKGVMLSGFGSTSVDTGNAPVNDLLATRGMKGMLSTIWLILCAICFGGALKASGILMNIVSLIIPLTKTRFGLVSSTVLSGLFFNTTVSDQYLSIMLDSSMFKEIYKREGSLITQLKYKQKKEARNLSSRLVSFSFHLLNFFLIQKVMA